MIAVPFRSARHLAGQIRRKKIGSLELLDLYLARVDKYNPTLNAIIATDVEAARRRARAADDALAKGETWGPLHGLPITLKDVHDTAGLRSTMGYRPLADRIA